MSITANERIDESLDSLCESKGMPNVREVRARELADSSFFQHRWFEDGYKFTTKNSRIRDRYFRIYKNSFSRRRGRLDELGRVSLNNHKRK